MVDAEGKGMIEEDDLVTALGAARVKVHRDEIRLLMRMADKDRDGKIDRDDWEKLARMCTAGSRDLSSSFRHAMREESIRRRPMRRPTHSRHHVPLGVRPWHQRNSDT